METASTTLNSNDDEQELFVTNKKYNTLDQCIDDAQVQLDQLFNIVNLVRGQPPTKKQKLKDLEPSVFVRLNSRMGKAKPVTLKCLLDTGAAGSLISKEHTKKLRHKKLEGTQTDWMTPGGDLKTKTTNVNALSLCLNSFEKRLSNGTYMSHPKLGGVQHDHRTRHSVCPGIQIRFGYYDD
jgi:Aspartyl protease